MNTDVHLNFTYPIANPAGWSVDTDAKESALEEILEAYVRSIMGAAGQDYSEPNKQEVYYINMRLDLSDDTFYISSNCGNKGLEAGIIMDILKRLPQKS